MDRPSNWLDAENFDGDAWAAIKFNVTEDFEDLLTELGWLLDPPAWRMPWTSLL